MTSSCASRKDISVPFLGYRLIMPSSPNTEAALGADVWMDIDKVGGEVEGIAEGTPVEVDSFTPLIDIASAPLARSNHEANNINNPLMDYNVTGTVRDECGTSRTEKRAGE